MFLKVVKLIKGLCRHFIETKISAKQIYFGAFSNPNSEANSEIKNKLEQLKLYVKQNIFSNCLQVLLSILRNFKLINMHLLPLKSLENHRFSGDFTGSSSVLILWKSLNTGSEILRGIPFQYFYSEKVNCPLFKQL